MDKGGLPLKIKQTEVDDIVSLIDDTNKALARHQVKIKTHTKKLAGVEKDIENQKIELEKEIEAHENKKQEIKDLVEQGKSVADKFNSAQEILDKTQEELEVVTQKYQKLKGKVSKFETQELDLTNQIDTFSQNLKQLESSKNACTDKLSELDNKKKVLYEISPELAAPLRVLEAEEVEEIDPRQIKQKMTKLQDKLKSISPNMGAITEFRAKSKECEDRNSELGDLTAKRDNQQNICEQLRKKRLEEFMKGFAAINRKLKEMYRMITLEGDATLDFVDSLDPFGEGIVFSVRPPKKSWKPIANLSGGEKVNYFIKHGYFKDILIISIKYLFSFNIDF